jgi:hypothetical protein
MVSFERWIILYKDFRPCVKKNTRRKIKENKIPIISFSLRSLISTTLSTRKIIIKIPDKRARLKPIFSQKRKSKRRLIMSKVTKNFEG